MCEMAEKALLANAEKFAIILCIKWHKMRYWPMLRNLLLYYISVEWHKMSYWPTLRNLQVIAMKGLTAKLIACCTPGAMSPTHNETTFVHIHRGGIVFFVAYQVV